MIRPISSSDGQPLIYVPLFVIVTISALKDLFEDLDRKKDDSKENNSKSQRLTADGFKECKWDKIRVGDIIKVTFLLHSSIRYRPGYYHIFIKLTTLLG